MPLFKRIFQSIRRRVFPYTRLLGYLTRNYYRQIPIILSDNDAHIFAGYYDVTPIEPVYQSKILALRCPHDEKSPHDSNCKAEIVFFDISCKNRKLHRISTTYCWNWQQGCRLQWVPSHADMIAYNDYLDLHGRCIMLSIESGETIHFPVPLYSFHESGKKFLSLSFERMHVFRRGYGYHQNAALDNLDKAPHDDGIWSYDIETNDLSLLVSLRQLADFQSSQLMSEAYHYINHAKWLPDGRIVFYHLWHNGRTKKQSRLMMLDAGGKLSSIDSELRPSHTANGFDAKNFLVTGIKNGIKGLYHTYDLDRGVYKGATFDIYEDGHPTFLAEDLIVTDTYPDLFGRQSVYLKNRDGKKTILAKVFLPPEFSGELRCDTHPRVSSDNKMVAFDFVKGRRRAVAILPLDKKG